MKLTQQQIEDRLLEALLHEQNRSDKDQALTEIEAALDTGFKSNNSQAHPSWAKRLGTIAACATVGGLVIFGITSIQKSKQVPPVAARKTSPANNAEDALRSLNELKQSIREQSDKVEERRKVLATIVRTKGILYTEGDDSFFVPGDQSGQFSLERYNALEQERVLLASQIDGLLKYTGDELIAYGASLDLPENILKSLYPQYLDLKRQVAALKLQGLGDNHPTIVSTLGLIEQIKRQLDEGIIGLRATLQAQLDLAEDRLAKVKVLRDDKKDDVIKRGLDAQDYVDAKRDFETDLALLHSMQQKSTGEQIGAPHSGAFPPLGGDMAEMASPRKGPVSPVAPAPANFVFPSETGSEQYGPLIDPTWQNPTKTPLSTFSIDVDNASYSNVRRMIREGQNIPTDAVRIEEFVNAFNYNYAKPVGDKDFALHTTLATCPWNERHLLMKVGIKGREIDSRQRPVSNLVFLIDVSGSMNEPNKLPLVKESLKLLLHQLDERDSVSFVVYASSEGVVLPPTKLTETGRVTALAALENLQAGGSTNGGSGIQRAYQIAKENFAEGGTNRVILATDGDFNVGVTDNTQLVSLVKDRAKENIYLSVLGFGTGNLNEAMLESISKDGNGNHYYIDSIREGRKVLMEKLSGTLITIAKDVKIQIEFNPAKVGSYRLIGYANRQLKDEDFNNDRVDAGDIGAGHTVTAFYEIVPTGLEQPTGSVDPLKYQKADKPVSPEVAKDSDEWLSLKLRHKKPEGDVSALEQTTVKGPAIRWQNSDGDFSFASAVALFGMKLRGIEEATNVSWQQIHDLAAAGLKEDQNESRKEFIELVKAMEDRGK